MSQQCSQAQQRALLLVALIFLTAAAQRRLVLSLQHHIDHFQPRAAAHSLWNYPSSLWIDAGEQAPACQAHSQLRCQNKIAQQLQLSYRPCSTEA